jgi:hypothetical protein
MTHTPSVRRSLRPFVRAAFAAALLVGCALGTVGADVVILKDGFVIQGKVTKETDKITDKASGQTFVVLAARGFDLVDDGPKFVIFSSNSKQLGEINKDVKIRPDYRAYTTTVVRRKNDPPPYGRFEQQGDWDAKWKRTLKVHEPGGGFNLIEQQIASLDPYKCLVYSTTHSWRLAFRTVEIGPDGVRKLLSTHPDLSDPPGKPDPARRLTIARFLKDAGWLMPAKQEVEALRMLFPGGLPKEASEQADALMKEIDQGLAEAIVQEAELGLAAGRYDAVGRLLAAFPDKTADPKDAVRAAALRAQHKAAVERYTTARRHLRALLDRTGGATGLGPSAVGGGPAAAAVLLRGPRPNAQVTKLLAAGEQVYAELHPDNVGRLEDFILFVEQAERERKQGQEPTRTVDRLLAAAVSGWVKGKTGTIEEGTPAVRLWAARELVLAYQRTDDLNTHNQLLRAFPQEANLPPGELAQVITLLPPAEPEDLTARTGARVPPTTELPVPPDVFRRNSAPSYEHPRGVEYLIRLPAEYHHGRAYPVVIALTDAVASPEIITTALAYEADRSGYILATPNWVKAGPDWKWRGEDHTYATEVLRDVIRHFNVDNDRVFLFGGGSGADMAMDVGCSHPDLFAGVLAMVPTPKTLLIQHYWKNAQKLPVYVVTGEQTGPGMQLLRKLFEHWMPKGYPAILTIYKGRGAEWYGSEVSVMFDWMSRKRRPGPRSVLQPDPTNTTPPWQAFRETDNRFYWLGPSRLVENRQFDPARPQAGAPATIGGDIQAGNRIVIRSTGTRQVTVWLDRDLIDWNKPLVVTVGQRAPLKVSVNGAPPTDWKPRKIEPSLEVLLNDYTERGDRRVLFLQKLSFPAEP